MTIGLQRIVMQANHLPSFRHLIVFILHTCLTDHTSHCDPRSRDMCNSQGAVVPCERPPRASRCCKLLGACRRRRCYWATDGHRQPPGNRDGRSDRHHCYQQSLPAVTSGHYRLLPATVTGCYWHPQVQTARPLSAGWAKWPLCDSNRMATTGVQEKLYCLVSSKYVGGFVYLFLHCVSSIWSISGCLYFRTYFSFTLFIYILSGAHFNQLSFIVTLWIQVIKRIIRK